MAYGKLLLMACDVVPTLWKQKQKAEVTHLPALDQQWLQGSFFLDMPLCSSLWKKYTTPPDIKPLAISLDNCKPHLHIPCQHSYTSALKVA